MEENKNIDRLFQEKLKNLDAKPNKRVWKNIEAQINKKKQKRILPIWWFSSGIAAILVLGFFLFPFSEDDNLNKKQNFEIITSSPENDLEDKSNKNTDFNAPENENIKQEEVLVSVEKQIKKTKKTTSNNKSFIAENKKNSKQENSKNITEKENTLDSKNAMKKIFKSKNTEVFVEKKSDKKELTLKPKQDFATVINKKDSLKLDVNSSKKWAVSPSFAVLNSNSFSNNSSLDANLNSSPTSGENTYSYGVKVAYKINKKWTIQSGVHLQEMSFSTRNVVVSGSLSRQSLSNVNSNAQLGFNTSVAPQFLDVRSNANLLAKNEQGELNQRFGYIEIPLEIKYNLLNSNKFKTEIVTGFSSLFLNKNSVNLSSNSFSGTIGEANNLNNINFSGNFGFDFNYAVDKNLFLNLNPMFKAQLNTFSRNSNGVQPYFFGIYTGIKYQF